MHIVSQNAMFGCFPTLFPLQNIDDWRGRNFVVSWTTPCDITPSPWPFCLPYRHPTSCFSHPSHIHHLCRALDGVWKPGESEYTTLILPSPALPLTLLHSRHPLYTIPLINHTNTWHMDVHTPPEWLVPSHFTPAIPLPFHHFLSLKLTLEGFHVLILLKYFHLLVTQAFGVVVTHRVRCFVMRRAAVRFPARPIPFRKIPTDISHFRIPIWPIN